MYKDEIAGRFAPLLLLNDGDPQQICDEFTNITINTAEDILGRRKETKKPWTTTEILRKCKERRELQKNRF